MNDVLANPWTITVLGGILVAVVSYFVLGIGKQKNSKANNNSISAGASIQAGGDIITGGRKVENRIRSEKPQNPDIRVYHKVIRNRAIIELANIGRSSLVDLQASICWKQEDGEHTRDLNEFLPKGADLVMSHPYQENILEPGKQVWAIEIPLHSEDNKITVEVQGKNATDDSNYIRKFELTDINDKGTSATITWI